MRAMEMKVRISPLSEIDADLHLYYSIDFYPSQYHYYDEDSFPKLIRYLEKTTWSFSLYQKLET